MISFLICAFNEEKQIESTYDSIKKALISTGIKDYEIVIVNDGSLDDTESQVKKLLVKDKNVIYLKNQINLGYGNTLRKGLENINKDKFLIVPGDNDLPSDTITYALNNMNKADMIMFFPVNTDNRSKIRNVISILYRLVYLISFDCYVNYINAPCIYPTRKVKELKLISNRFSIISEITTKLLHSEITYCELPAFFQKSLRKRKTVTLKNLSDVIISYLKLYYEIKITKKNLFKTKAKRLNIYNFN